MHKAYIVHLGYVWEDNFFFSFCYSNINIYDISLHLTIPILITIQHYMYDTVGSERQ